jgi:Family of unknown function (DUF5519)
MDRERHAVTIGHTNPKNDGKVLAPRAAIEAVRAAVASWQGVTTHDHRFGGIEFRLGRRELGHRTEPSQTCPSRDVCETSSLRAGAPEPTMCFRNLVG